MGMRLSSPMTITFADENGKWRGGGQEGSKNLSECEEYSLQSNRARNMDPCHIKHVCEEGRWETKFADNISPHLWRLLRATNIPEELTLNWQRASAAFLTQSPPNLPSPRLAGCTWEPAHLHVGTCTHLHTWLPLPPHLSLPVLPASPSQLNNQQQRERTNSYTVLRNLLCSSLYLVV